MSLLTHSGVRFVEVDGRTLASFEVTPQPCADADGDGICDTEDNCLGVSNPDQLDTNYQRLGDAQAH